MQGLPSEGKDKTEVTALMDWKDDIRPILEVYVDRTPGSNLEEKEHSLGWHYRKVEPEMGALRSNELMDELEGFVANTPLKILHGKKIIEIKHSSISKGVAVHGLLNGDNNYSFILAAGDDTTDEEMFEALPEGSWSIKVGDENQSNAKYRLASHKKIRELLGQMANSER
jgi:trehalose 6-phosphate synthase/phosphatase